LPPIGLVAAEARQGQRYSRPEVRLPARFHRSAGGTRGVLAAQEVVDRSGQGLGVVVVLLVEREVGGIGQPAGLTSFMSPVGSPSSSRTGSSVSSMPVAQRRGRPTYSLVTIMSARDLFRASTNGFRSSISLGPYS